MPSKTLKQHSFMAICKHARESAQGKCPPPKVVNEFMAADRGKHFSQKESKRGHVKST